MHTQARHTTWARSTITTLLCALVMSAHAAAPAQASAKTTQVHRCKQADGQLMYSQQACSTEADVLHVQDQRSAQQVSDARSTHERELALAKRQARERRKMERLGGETPARALTVASKPPAPSKSVKAKDPRAPVPFEPSEHVERKRHFRAVVPKDAASKPAASSRVAN